MTILKTLSVLRMRNKSNVIYFRDSQDDKATQLRATNPNLFHAHLYHYGVSVHFPEVLFTGRILPRSTDYCQHYAEHEVFLAENGTFAAYFQTQEQAENAIASNAELFGAKAEQVTVKLQDIEALCHGQPVAILTDEVRNKLFGTSMTSLFTEDHVKNMKVTSTYKNKEQVAPMESPLERELEAAKTPTSKGHLRAVA